MLIATDRPERACDTVALLTPSYRRDLERCKLLFETVDRHLTRRGPHYVIVHDEDVPLFAPYASAHRIVLPTSRFLPWSMPHLPLRWRGRSYWFHPHGRPLSGWHVQQIVKIAAAATLPHARVWMIDSDNFFFRDFDVASLDSRNPVRVLVQPTGITAALPDHVVWLGTAHRLLGLPAPVLPAPDYINQLVLWDQETLRAALARVEAVTGRRWVDALARERDFSEYLVYGSFVGQGAGLPARHVETTEDLCRTHWGHEGLDADGITRLIRSAAPAEVALCIQSFGETPLSEIRRGLERAGGERADDLRKRA